MIHLTLTKDIKRSYQPKRKDFLHLLNHALLTRYNTVSIEVLITNLAASHRLNNEYRKQNKPTNVIAIEYKDPRERFSMLTGEIIFCDEIIVQEALEQGKSICDHYAHLFVHGVLHLQAFDHQDANSAKVMEQHEIEILARVGIANPYI